MHDKPAHGIQTIVITTKEGADAMLAHLDACKQKAERDNYASERKKPIKCLECSCCGDGFLGRDWWNQEPGYGLCDGCAAKHYGYSVGTRSESHGVGGIHYLLPPEERDNPPVVPDRGVPLYGLDPRLRIEYDGYVYWKGHQIEHFSHGALYDTEENRVTARELMRRCEALESRGADVNVGSVIWQWNG